MRESMLGKIVVLVNDMPTIAMGLLVDLLEKLNSSEGGEWRANLAKFLRKEPCWVKVAEKTTVYQLVVDYAKSLGDMVRAGKYNWTGAGINETNFPRTGGAVAGRGLETVDAELLEFNRPISSDSAVAEMKRLGYRPATIEELLSFGAMVLETKRQFPVVALGSFYVINGKRRVAYLHRFNSMRGPSLGEWDNDWDSEFRFLAVRLGTQVVSRPHVFQD